MRDRLPTVLQSSFFPIQKGPVRPATGVVVGDPNLNRTAVFIIDGSGSPLTTGVKGDLTVHFNCEITGWRLLADQSGSIVVDVWKADYAGYPPTVTNTITGADLPELVATDHNENLNVTAWKTGVSANDTFRVNIVSTSTVTRVTLTLALLTR